MPLNVAHSLSVSALEVPMLAQGGDFSGKFLRSSACSSMLMPTPTSARGQIMPQPTSATLITGLGERDHKSNRQWHTSCV